MKPLRPYRPAVRGELVKLLGGGAINLTTPAWFLNSANPPKDRGKRGMRTRPSKGRPKCRFWGTS